MLMAAGYFTGLAIDLFYETTQSSAYHRAYLPVNEELLQNVRFLINTCQSRELLGDFILTRWVKF